MGLFLTIFGDIARTVTVYRTGAVTHVKGRALRPASTTLEIKATIQPIKPKDLEVLPEGTKTSDARVFHTETEITTGSAPDGSMADEVEDAGERWVVKSVAPWAEFADFYRAVCLKVGQ